jgi:hypothetical protein
MSKVNWIRRCTGPVYVLRQVYGDSLSKVKETNGQAFGDNVAPCNITKHTPPRCVPRQYDPGLRIACPVVNAEYLTLND